MVKAFDNYEVIISYPKEERLRAWLLDYEGLHFSIGKNGADLIKWQEEKDEYIYSNNLWKDWFLEVSILDNDNWIKKYVYARDINKIQRHKKRLIIEFDDKDISKIPAHIEAVKKKLKEVDAGFIESSHKGKSNYIWVEFTRELTSNEAENFLAWIAPKGSEIDLNFCSDNKRFPVLFAPHWKYGNIEEPVEFVAGEQIDYDSLKIKNERVRKNVVNGYETYEKGFNSQEERIKSFLAEERQKFESLGCGYHNGVHYFGTTLFREGEPYTAIVTEDKKIYLNTPKNNEIRNIFGLNYKFDFYSEGLDNIFSREAIHKWLFEDTEDITLNSLYNKLVETWKKYIYFEDPRKYSLLACYRISSFFMPIWRARARLFSWADMGSAKSRQTQMFHNTGFNSVSLGDWTLPYLQRLIESTRGETHIDDFETLPEEQRNTTIRLVKVGFMKGFKAGKIGEGKKKEPETFDLFNTTTINNTEGLDFISLDRCITIRIPKIAKKEYDKEPNFEEPIWKELRDSLYICGLKYAQEVKKTYETISSDKIRARLFLIIKPELTIAKLISQEVYNNIENFWTEELKQRKSIDYETDWEFLAYKEIFNRLLSTHSTLSSNSTLSTLSTEEEFKLKDITHSIHSQLYSGLESDNPAEFKKKKAQISIVLGNSFSRNPIFKNRESKGINYYKVKGEEFQDFLESKGYLKIIKDILEVKNL